MGCVLGLFLLGLIFIMIRNIWIILGKGKDGIFESGWESDRLICLNFSYIINNTNSTILLLRY